MNRSQKATSALAARSKAGGSHGLNARALLGAHALEVGYSGAAILPAISLNVLAGDCWAVIGPNGAGKSTLVRTLLGLHPAVAGALIGGRTLGYVPQRTGIHDRAAGLARDVVRSGCERGWSFAKPWRGASNLVANALERAGCVAFAGERYSELSDGQRQRVLVARALAGGAEVLVLDEPTSAMDPESSVETGALLTRLARQDGLGVIVVTHDLAFADQIATHILVLDRAREWAFSGPRDVVTELAEVRGRYASAFGAARVPQRGTETASAHATAREGETAGGPNA